MDQKNGKQLTKSRVKKLALAIKQTIRTIWFYFFAN